MPNYCENYTQITGPQAEIERFAIAAIDDEGEFRLANILPLPPEAHGESISGIDVFAPGGKEIAVELWGTKWADFDGDFDLETGSYQYRTAWSPMDLGIQKISALFPKLKFHTYWHEEDFHYGAFKCEKGEVFHAESGGRLEMPEPPSDDNEAVYDRFWEDQQIRLAGAARSLVLQLPSSP